MFKTLVYLLLITLSCSLLTSSCKKKSSSTSTTTTSSPPNSIVLTIDGKQYTATGWKPNSNPPKQDYILCYVDKFSTGNSYFTISNYGESHQFTLNIEGVSGPSNGIGDFNITSKDGKFTETFQGGDSYDIVGGKFTVTILTNDKITGTMSINLKNSTKTKTLTGSFDINQPN